MPLPIADLKPDQCRWPVDTSGTPRRPVHLFCSDKTTPGKSYCAGHERAARGVGTVGERLAAKALRFWLLSERRLAEAVR